MMREAEHNLAGRLQQKHTRLSCAVPGKCGGGAQSSTAPCPSLTYTDSLSSDEKRSRSERGRDKINCKAVSDSRAPQNLLSYIHIWASPIANFHKTYTKGLDEVQQLLLNWAVVFSKNVHYPWWQHEVRPFTNCSFHTTYDLSQLPLQLQCA